MAESKRGLKEINDESEIMTLRRSQGGGDITKDLKGEKLAEGG